MVRCALIIKIFISLVLVASTAHAGYDFSQGNIRQAYQLLGLDYQLYDAAQVKAAWKQSIRTNHPDLGGDVETAKAINAAYDLVMAALARGIVPNQDSTVDSTIFPAEFWSQFSEQSSETSSGTRSTLPNFEIRDVFENENGFVFRFDRYRPEPFTGWFWKPKGAAYASKIIDIGGGFDSTDRAVGTTWLETQIFDTRLRNGLTSFKISGNEMNIGSEKFHRRSSADGILSSRTRFIVNSMLAEGWRIWNYSVFDGGDKYYVIAEPENNVGGEFIQQALSQFKLFTVSKLDSNKIEEHVIRYDAERRAVFSGNGERLYFNDSAQSRMPIFDEVTQRFFGFYKVLFPSSVLTIKDGQTTVGQFRPLTALELRGLSFMRYFGKFVDFPPALSTPLDPVFERALKSISAPPRTLPNHSCDQIFGQ